MIIISAKVETEERIAGIAVGAEYYITKPFAPAEVVASVQACFERIEEEIVDELTSKLRGSIIMHAGFSVAGFGPTTSGKEAIQGSMQALARAGVKIHLGKGSLKEDTIESLNEFNSIFAVTAPVTALMMKKVKSVRVVGFEHEGMEALHEVEVDGMQAIVSIAHGRSIFERRVNASD